MIESVQAFSSCARVEPLLINLAKELSLSDPNSLERAMALTALASHYFKQGPDQYLRAENLLSEALYISVDPTTGLPSPRIQYEVNIVLLCQAHKRGNYELALVYLERSITALDEWLKRDNALAHACRIAKVYYLERLEKVEGGCRGETTVLSGRRCEWVEYKLSQIADYSDFQLQITSHTRVYYTISVVEVVNILSKRA